MSKTWDFAQLTKTASENGGPDEFIKMIRQESYQQGVDDMKRWVEIIKEASYKKGAADMKNILIAPLLGTGISLGVLGCVATRKIIKWVKENKEKKLITEQEATRAEAYLLQELIESINEIEEK